MVILEGITILVFQKDTGNMASGKRIVVAVGSQISSVQCIEVMLPFVDLFKERETAHALIAHLTILNRVIVTNHIYIEQIFDLLEWHNRMFNIPGGSTQVGILARKGQEVHVVWRTVLGIVCCQCHDGGSARGIVVGTSIEDFPAQIAYMVIMRCENVTAIMPLALYLGDDVEALIVFQKLVVHLHTDVSPTKWACPPHNGHRPRKI